METSGREIITAALWAHGYNHSGHTDGMARKSTTVITASPEYTI